MNKVVRILCLATLGLTVIVSAVAQESIEPKAVEIDTYYRVSWIMAPDVAAEPPAEGRGTRSLLLSVIRAVDPNTGLPYDNSIPKLGFAAKDLRHFFRLEKSEFVLGEPILVEHRIELNGPGELEWSVGGNYRARGRDDNFSFILRREDGLIVPDVYPKLEGLVFGGGLGWNPTISRGQPLSYWLGLQRYAAITEPGTYDLYCFTGNKGITLGRVEALRAALPDDIRVDHYVDDRGSLIDRTTEAPSKRYALTENPHYVQSEAERPLNGMIPAEHLSSLNINAKTLGTVAHFRIDIRKGTHAERRQMITQWARAAESIKRFAVTGSFDNALSDGLWYAQQDLFQPLLEKWIINFKGRDVSTPIHLEGLAMRPDSSAFALLLKSQPNEVVNAFYSLHPNKIAEAVPICIGWLTHADQEVRARSESLLTRWTGQSSEQLWKAYNDQRPTLFEGQSTQSLWHAWWAKNRSGFKPQKPCAFPCKITEKTSQ